MFLWYCVLSIVIVAEVFRSPKLDYRLVVLGALLPLLSFLVDVLFFVHSIWFPILFLALVMAMTVGRRLLRRRLLGLPIGLFMHLVLNGSWQHKELFWWPVFEVFSETSIPVLSEQPDFEIRLVLEVFSLFVSWWAWNRYALKKKEYRSLFLKSGNFHRSVFQ